ncbi:MAG: DUF4339 domain-containing protein [Bacteroidales bacterium]|nr:DUF4339 domain-containing protein [Bacteroidales bacterium]
MKYYAIIGHRKVGPSTPGELAIHGITNDTYVWCEGMPSWQRAVNVEDFRGLCISTGSQYTFPSSPAIAYSKKNAHKRKHKKIIVIVSLIVLILGGTSIGGYFIIDNIQENIKKEQDLQRGKPIYDQAMIDYNAAVIALNEYIDKNILKMQNSNYTWEYKCRYEDEENRDRQELLKRIEKPKKDAEYYYKIGDKGALIEAGEKLRRERSLWEDNASRE